MTSTSLARSAGSTTSSSYASTPRGGVGTLGRSPTSGGRSVLTIAPSARSSRASQSQPARLLQLLRNLLTPPSASSAESAVPMPEALSFFALAFLGRLATFPGEWSGLLLTVRRNATRWRRRGPFLRRKRCERAAGHGAAGGPVLAVAVPAARLGVHDARARADAALQRPHPLGAPGPPIGERPDSAGRKGRVGPARARRLAALHRRGSANTNAESRRRNRVEGSPILDIRRLFVSSRAGWRPCWRFAPPTHSGHSCRSTGRPSSPA